MTTVALERRPAVPLALPLALPEGPQAPAGRGGPIRLLHSLRAAGYVDLALAQAVPLGVSFVLTLGSAPLLGPEGRGILTFLMTAALLVGALAYGSLHVPVVDALRMGDRSHLRHGVLFVAGIWAVLTAAGAVLVWWAWPVSGLRVPSATFEIGWSLVGGAVVVAQLFAGRVLQGLANNRQYQRVVVGQSLCYLAGAGAVLLTTRSPWLMFAAWYVSVLLSIALATGYLRGFLRGVPPRAPGARSWPRFFRAATANNVGSIGQMVMLRADVLVVGLLLGPAAAGVYGIALSLTELSLVAPEVFSLAVYGNRARMAEESWSGHVRRTFRGHALTWLLVGAAILAAAVVLSRGPLASFHGLVPLVSIILPGAFFAGYTRIALSVLQARSAASTVWRFGVVCLLLAACYFPAVALEGMTGAAVMSSVAYAASALFLRVNLRRPLPAGAPA